ncbi:MAG: M48 family metallopeptidase, partial [Burkholderiaceae bacterium]
MDFFGQQEQARRQSRTLVLLFALAVILIVVCVNLALALLWIWANGEPLSAAHQYPRGFFATNTVVTVALIGTGTLIQSWNLRDGGDAVARMAGGRPVAPATTEPSERRLLNVVEEMALASGIACPRVYLLDKEEAINAFAAGHTPNQAAIAVTRGAVTRLSRDELQGVVAHEFSHILNGDMRLNVNLIGVLFGIQMIAGFGRTLMDFGARVWARRGRDEKGPPLQLVLMAVGAVLFVIGYIGIFFGRLIKAGVSRQREFLADASAVQFTRNPDGIGGALRKIGGLGRKGGLGSRIGHPNAEQLSHLFLGAALPRFAHGWLATHPPLAERLRRIYGRVMEPLDAPEIAPEAPASEPMLPDIPYFTPATTA